MADMPPTWFSAFPRKLIEVTLTIKRSSIVDQNAILGQNVNVFNHVQD